MSIEDRITPTPDELAELMAKVERLQAATRAAMQESQIVGNASVQGSIAKGTWLAGNTDVDLFILLDPTLDQNALKQVPEKIGPKVLENCRKKYAQHPYLVGDFEGLQVDLVPAYAVQAAGDHMSAVDRTPFHTAWVQSNLQDPLQVRLAKQWSKGVGIYGADTATGGFSGYLLEVLIIQLGGFEAFIQWLADDAKPRRLAVADDRVDDDVSPLVVVDPVDATRNCAAAVQVPVLEAAVAAARAFQAEASDLYFFPNPPHDLAAAEMQGHLDNNSESWLALELVPQTDRLDIVLPQFHKAERMFTAALEKAGFTVKRSQVDADERVVMQWVLDAAPLPETIWHEGPAVTAQPNAERFTAKWAKHPDALGAPMERDGKLVVEVRTPHRHPAQWLAWFLPRAQTGKHVQAALKAATIHDKPVNGFWPPTTSDFILNRRPWHRP